MDLSQILTPDILDRISALRFPASTTTPTQVLSEARKWSQELSSEFEDELRKLTLPILLELGRTYGPEPTELRSVLVEPLFQDPQTIATSNSPASILPPRSDPLFLTRAIALVFLLDQCPRMYLTTGTDPRWVARFFDAVSQEYIWQVLLRADNHTDASAPLPSDSLEHYDSLWSKAGYSYDQYLLISSLMFTAADHSEDINRHIILREINVRRRADIFARTKEEHRFIEAADPDDIYAFSRWFRRGLPGFGSVQEFAYLRCAVIDVHWPIIKKFGRYPFRNAALGRKCTEEEESFLVESGRFGEVNADSKERIRADVDAGRWTALQGV